MTILSSNDLHTLTTAMRALKPITLRRTLDDATVTASVKPAAPVWGVPMVVQIRVERKGSMWVQSFGSVEEMREAMG